MTRTTTTPEGLTVLFRALRLPSFAIHYEEVAHRVEQDGWTFTDGLRYLAEQEIEDRRRRRIARNLKRADLQKGKTLQTLDTARLPAKVRRQLPSLCEGSFVGRADNVLAFGLPGRGKTHTCCAIANELIQRGYTVLFIPAFKLVQRLLVAKRELELEAELRRLDRIDVVLLDDIGYIQQDREEMEVLFTFLAERYERRSVMITSNLVFSQWDRIFKDPMTTACAIDRVVHHSIILEMTGRSVRADEANERIEMESTQEDQGES